MSDDRTRDEPEIVLDGGVLGATGGIEPTAVPADERERASRELRDLGAHWNEHIEALDERSAGDIATAQRSLLMDATRRFSQNRLAVASLVVLMVLVVLAILVPWLDHAPYKFHPSSTAGKGHVDPNLGASWHHPFGTDLFGRDEWVRAWIGARISLLIGFAVALVILVVGLIYGAVAGYFGGRVDNAMMRLLDSLYGLPQIPFSIIMIEIVRNRLHNASPLLYMVPALSITAWFTAARIVRNQILSLKENEFVESARSSGAKGWRIITRHLIPNILGIMVVSIFLEVPGAILGEAVLSILGLGVQSPNTSWGTMANEGYTYFQDHPLLIVVPGALIAITILAATAVGDGLRDALDPRAEGH